MYTFAVGDAFPWVMAALLELLPRRGRLTPGIGRGLLNSNPEFWLSLNEEDSSRYENDTNRN